MTKIFFLVLVSLNLQFIFSFPTETNKHEDILVFRKGHKVSFYPIFTDRDELSCTKNCYVSINEVICTKPHRAMTWYCDSKDLRFSIMKLHQINMQCVDTDEKRFCTLSYELSFKRVFYFILLVCLFLIIFYSIKSMRNYEEEKTLKIAIDRANENNFHTSISSYTCEPPSYQEYQNYSSVVPARNLEKFEMKY